MTVSFKSTFSAAKHVKRITDQTNQRMGRAVQDAKSEILARTEKGEGAEGKLKPYSPKYAEYKKQKLGRTTVNLRETGGMLNAMQTASEILRDGVLGRIFFLASERQKVIWNMKIRPNFFKLSRKQLQTIIRKLKGQ